jgi:hypothetical protein
MSGRKVSNDDNRVPGPGSYNNNTDINFKDTSPSYR